MPFAPSLTAILASSIDITPLITIGDGRPLRIVPIVFHGIGAFSGQRPESRKACTARAACRPLRAATSAVSAAWIRLPAAKTPHEQTGLQNQIDATDRQIDRLAYELYGLTEEEIGIVEEKQ